MSTVSTITITREQLYERVWSEPATKVALAFGLSSVAVKKMCRRMNVPTPSRGYWARLAAGQKVSKVLLPEKGKDSAAMESKQIDAEANTQRREALQKGLPPPISISSGNNRLELPATLQISRLHPRSCAFHDRLMIGKAEQNGIVRLNSSEFPLVHVSKATAERTARVLHVIYSELESRGVELRPVKFNHETHLGFAHGPDTVGIVIEESIESIRRKPTLEELRRPSREWNLESMQATGLLRISLRERIDDWSTNNKFRRNEGPNRPIEELLHEIVERIWSFFVTRAERREEEKIAKEARAKAEAERRAEEEKQRQLEAERKALAGKLHQEIARQERHRKKLESLAVTRVENLLRAAEWWRLQQLTFDYVDACKRQWQGTTAKSKPLSEAQEKWLAWAHTEIQAMALGTSGYPGGERDGMLDTSTIPVGGPYPEERELPLPPTFWPPKKFFDELQKSAPKKEQTAPKEPPKESSPPPPVYRESQFPFWLMHRNRR